MFTAYSYHAYFGPSVPPSLHSSQREGVAKAGDKEAEAFAMISLPTHPQPRNPARGRATGMSFQTCVRGSEKRGACSRRDAKGCAVRVTGAVGRARAAVRGAVGDTDGELSTCRFFVSYALGRFKTGVAF